MIQGALSMASESIKPRPLYFADHSNITVTKVFTTELSHKDSAGNYIYTNTHLSTELEAWKCVIENALAGVRLDGQAVLQAEAALLKAQMRAAEAAKLYALAQDRFRDFQRQQPQGE